jgi:peroxiredoxin
MAHGYRELADRFKQHDIVIYGMNDKGAQANKEWVERENLPFRVLQDVGRTVGASLAMSDPGGDRYVKKSEEGRRPAIVIDEDGFILAWEQDMNTIEAIEALLNQIT